MHQARLSNNYQDVSAVGMYETSITKGHEYISLFVDLERKKTIFVGDGKGAEVVKEFAEDFAEHGGKTEQIKDVSFPSLICSRWRLCGCEKLFSNLLGILKTLYKVANIIFKNRSRIIQLGG